MKGCVEIMDAQKTTKMLERFKTTFGSADNLCCARAPGRVNLIGEHTDYNGGFVLPMGIDREVRLFFRPVEDGPVRVWSENYGEWDEFVLEDIQPNPEQPWANYIRGAAWAMREAGQRIRPVEAILIGDVPIGAGLSSSAALEVASALALCGKAAEGDIPRKNVALACQRAENEFVGVNCGIMDQFVSLHAEKNRAVLIDCRTLDYKLLPLENSEVRVVVCNTMVDHELGSSAYNERRATCEKAVRIIADRVEESVEQLRDVSPDMLARCGDHLDAKTRRRAQHVVTEDERALAAVDALGERNYEEFGRLMNASHDSLRDDYEVSCEELNIMVEAAREQDGCLGARMTGAGFGGCTVNLVRREDAAQFTETIADSYQSRTDIEPEVYDFTACPGARVESC